jgi:hypothetical protein
VCIPQDARRDVASAANGDHEVGLKLIEDLLRRFLAELVNLYELRMSVSLHSLYVRLRIVRYL